MRFGTRVWGVSKVLLLVGALGATFLVCFLISMRIALQAGQVEVPDLRGKTVAQATQLLRDHGARPQLGSAKDAGRR